MILHDAYTVRNMDLIQFLHKVKQLQVEKFDKFVFDNFRNHILHENACTAVIRKYTGSDLPPIFKIPSTVFDEAHVRIAVAPYESDLLVLLLPGNTATQEMRNMLIEQLTLEVFSPNGQPAESLEQIAWRSIFDNVIYASPSNCMYSLVLSPVTLKNESADFTDYIKSNISAYISQLTPTQVSEFCRLTFPSVYRNIDLSKLEETLNDIKNEL